MVFDRYRTFLETVNSLFFDKKAKVRNTSLKHRYTI